MNSPSSPIVLYLDDDDDDNNNNNEQNQYYESNMSSAKASTSNDISTSRKKRKLTNTNVQINPSVVNWSKRLRNDHNQQRSSRNFGDPDLDPEPILLDPDEYIIEEPEPNSFRAFDWTIEPRQPPPPQPLPQLILPAATRLNPIQPTQRILSVPTSNATKRPADKTEINSTLSNQNDKLIQQQIKPISISTPRASLALLPLPLPKPTSSLIRPAAPRGRPVKHSRVPCSQSTSPPSATRQRTEPQISPQIQQTLRLRRPPAPALPPLPPAAPTVPASSTNISTSEIRRQALNGTGIFSAFHDSKFYRCNICKFKSVTSSSLLQHLFSHMFFCEQCSFYTYSHHNLSQHIFEKHNLNSIEENGHLLNPNSFDLLYITRCPDGKFALCADSSSSSPLPQTTISTKVPNNVPEQKIVTSTVVNDHQPQIKSPKKKINKQKKDLPKEEDNEVVVLSEKRDNNKRLIKKGKQNQTYVLMKHRRCYSIKRSPCLHSLSLEYNICREHTLRHICHTQGKLKRRNFLTKYNNTRLIDEIASCLRTMVNVIVESEENRLGDQSSLICTLPNNLLNPIIPTVDLNNLTNLLKLNNKYDQDKEENKLYECEHILRRSREHIFVLSSPETNHNEETIISSLHSSVTNGDSIFTQTKLNKLPISFDNTHRFIKGNLNQLSDIQPRLNNSNSKVQKKNNNNTTPSPPKLSPLRPVVSKPVRSLPNSSLPTIIDRNNNSITSPKPKLSPTKTPNIIVLD